MVTKIFFDSSVISEAQEASAFMADVLEASTEYSIIGKINVKIPHVPENIALGKPYEILAARWPSTFITRLIAPEALLEQIPCLMKNPCDART